jgi:hypothetical protein
VRSEEQELVTRALSRLRWTDQEILKLATWERLPHSGIARRLETGTEDPLRGYFVEPTPESGWQPSGCICPFTPDVFELVP